MIYCKLTDLVNYSLYSENMKKAIDYIMTHDLSVLPMGKTIVNGEKVFINKSSPETKESDLQQYEVHHKYIDIQIDLEGDEKLYIKNDNMICTCEYEEKYDYSLFKASEPDVIVNLNKEHCVICFPNEVHMPCVRNTTNNVIKCVIKVLND